MTLEKLSSSDKVVYLMGDFNIDLLKSEISDLSHDFLLSLQCYSFFPVTDKPTRVYNNSATLIDNIFANRFDNTISGGNIVSDISDHYSQFCFIHSLIPKNFTTKCKIRDYSNFSEENIIKDVSETDWDNSMANGTVYTNFFLLFITNLTSSLINTLLSRFHRSAKPNNTGIKSFSFLCGTQRILGQKVSTQSLGTHIFVAFTRTLILLIWY